MGKNNEKYKRFILISIAVIAIGVVVSTTNKDNLSVLGTIMIAVGGLLFIIGISLKNKTDNDEK